MRFTGAGREAQPERDLPGLEGLHADRRLHRLAQDRLGLALGDLLDLHAAMRVGHEHDALALPVEHQADVELALDRHRRLDVEPMHHLALGAGLVGHQPLAEQLGGGLAAPRPRWCRA